MILAGFALLGVVILGGVLLWLTQRDAGGSEGLANTMREAGCTFRSPPIQGRDHVRDGTEVNYNSLPGTSGDHYAQPAIFNAYDAEVEQQRLVHNLEHGGIAIQWGPRVPDATVNEIRQFYLDDPNGLVIAPFSRLGNKVALTAWGHLATCTEFNEGAYAAFRDEYRAKGPEPFQLEDLAPGS
jgi:hypothetical protein